MKDPKNENKQDKTNRERVKEAMNKRKDLDFNSHHVFS